MIAKWYPGFLAACDIASIISGIPQFYFNAYIERSTYLNNIGRTANLALPVTVVVVVLDGVLVLVVAVAVT